MGGKGGGVRERGGERQRERGGREGGREKDPNSDFLKIVDGHLTHQEREGREKVGERKDGRNGVINKHQQQQKRTHYDARTPRHNMELMHT